MKAFLYENRMGRFFKGGANRAFELLRLFQEVGAVDELGIGIVRDAFADKFFPGTFALMEFVLGDSTLISLLYSPLRYLVVVLYNP